MPYTANTTMRSLVALEAHGHGHKALTTYYPLVLIWNPNLNLLGGVRFKEVWSGCQDQHWGVLSKGRTEAGKGLEMAQGRDRTVLFLV